jgi:hypothetical protein
VLEVLEVLEWAWAKDYLQLGTEQHSPARPAETL